MASNPLLEVSDALSKTYTERFDYLEKGTGEYAPYWKAPENVITPTKANAAAGDLIGPAIADAKNASNMIPEFRKGNMLLALSRDYGSLARSRIARGGDYMRLLERETTGGSLKARMPK